MLARHKEQLPIIERSQELINRSVLGLQNPCQFCGTSYQRKSAHLKACAGIFNGVYVILRVGRGKELRDLSEDKHGTGQTLARQHGDGHGDMQTHEAAEMETGGTEHRQKYHKGAPKGWGQDRNHGKGRGQPRARAKDPAFFTNYWENRKRQNDRPAWEKGGGTRSQQSWDEQELIQDNPEDFKAVMAMMATLVLRHEAQHSIHKQDTSYVIFLKTDVPNNLAVFFYQIG